MSAQHRTERPEAPAGAGASEGAGASDGSLLGRIAAGDRDALAHLYDRHAPAAYALALVLAGDRPAAEDLVHDTFAAVWSGAARHGHRHGVRAWLLALLTERASAAQALHRDRRALRDEILWGTGAPDQPVDELRHAIAGGLGALPADEVDALVLAVRCGLTRGEIADRMGLSRDRTADVLDRALRSMTALRQRRAEASASSMPRALDC